MWDGPRVVYGWPRWRSLEQGHLVASAPSEGMSSQERAELTCGRPLIPTMQRERERRSWAKKMTSGE
jgi:hypothetical protein